MWICGYVDMWICGYVDMRICGYVWIYVDMWTKANLVYVVLACEHLKESVIGFGPISVVEPSKPVKGDVVAGGKICYFQFLGIKKEKLI